MQIRTKIGRWLHRLRPFHKPKSNRKGQILSSVILLLLVLGVTIRFQPVEARISAQLTTDTPRPVTITPLTTATSLSTPSPEPSATQSLQTPTVEPDMQATISARRTAAAEGLIPPQEITATITLTVTVTPTISPTVALTPVPPPPSPTATPTPGPDDILDQYIDQLIENMSVADRVGQLFVVTFDGNQVGPNSEIAELIKEYRIGGVVLSPENGNFSNAEDVDTPRQVATLINRLQAAAYGVTLAPEQALNPPLSLLELPDVLPLETAQSRPLGIPLLIGVDQAGDGLLRTSLRHGFTPIPPEMALGASWNPELARSLGEIVGKELSSVGVNLLLGPTLDVLDQTRPDIAGGAGIYALGSDPFWVSLLGRAYIEGIHIGSENRVATVANHFPGQGGSDRRPGEEVATIQKSLEALKRVDFRPFFSVTQYPSSILRTDGNPAATDGLMSSHSRYSSIQGSRERTPPISQATELGTILSQSEFADWRQGGGLVMTDALGVPAVRRAYDPTLQEFPSRLIALNSFLAGNDLLYLSRFALTDDWEAELANIKETIRFFEERYTSDPDFAARVDGSLKRILRLKLRFYIEEMPTNENAGRVADAFRIPLKNVLVREADLNNLSEERRAASLSKIGQVARESLTLLYPDSSATSLPSPPQPDERILIFTDSRELRECATCPGQPAIAPDALSSIMLRLYGPGATGQIDPNQLKTRTFAELKQLLDGTATSQQTVFMERDLESANWLIFAMLDVDTELSPDSDAVKQFLRQRGDRLTKKNIVVFAFNAPYFLDATEISKLTAYFGVYSKIQPFLEAAVRALFRGFPITGAPPLSVPGTRFDNLVERLQPDPDRTIDLRILNETAANNTNQNGEAAGEATSQTVLMMGDTLNVEAGPILDRNGNPVPDGTPVNFTLVFEGDELALPTQPALTRNGLAVISVLLDRGGALRITAASGDATSGTVVVNIQGEEAPTETPTATPQPSPTPSPTPPPSSPGEAGGSGEDGAQSMVHKARLDVSTLMIASLTMLAVLSLLLVVLVRIMPRPMLVHRFLWAIIAGWTSYILYGLGLIPGISSLRSTFHPWVIAPVVLIAMLIPLVWLQLRSE